MAGKDLRISPFPCDIPDAVVSGLRKCFTQLDIIPNCRSFRHPDWWDCDVLYCRDKKGYAYFMGNM